MTPPETRYARSGDLRIAYQVVGTGPRDLVFVPGSVSNFDLSWEMLEWANYFSGLHNFPDSSCSTSVVPASPTGLQAPPISKSGWTMFGRYLLDHRPLHDELRPTLQDLVPPFASVHPRDRLIGWQSC